MPKKLLPFYVTCPKFWQSKFGIDAATTNSKLQMLGWKGVALDYQSLQLALALMENWHNRLRLLIFIIKRSLAIPAMLAEFMRNASSNPSHLHNVHFTAARADTRHLRFAEPFNLGHMVKLWVSIL